MKSLFLRAAAVALALIAIPGAANAGWVTTGGTFFGSNSSIPGSGNTPDANATADGVVVFGVWKTTSNWKTELGLTSGQATNLNGTTSTGTEQYVYFMQVINTDTNQVVGPDHNLDEIFVHTLQDRVTSVGAVNGFGFQDLNGLMSITNTTVDVGGNPDANFTLAANGAASNIFDSEWTVSGSLHYDFTDISSSLNPNLSSVMFFTSDNPPAFGLSRIQNENANTLVGVPVPTPEPGTLALLGLGLPVLGWRYARRLKASKVVAEAVAK